jgi:fructose-specific component phosphotransferase system IIB-like protein
MPYLAQGLTVDDITTAIQTGWKMGGDSEGCELSYHKETNLLIVVGDASQFETVNGVLVALTQQTNAVLSAYLDDKKAKALAAPPTSARTETKKADK